jgi:hypothetical protein
MNQFGMPSVLEQRNIALMSIKFFDNGIWLESFSRSVLRQAQGDTGIDAAKLAL